MDAMMRNKRYRGFLSDDTDEQPRDRKLFVSDDETEGTSDKVNDNVNGLRNDEEKVTKPEAEDSSDTHVESDKETDNGNDA
jgi:hypothetical protein